MAGDRTDRNLVLCCMRAGAKEFLSAPIESQQLFSAIERVRKESTTKSQDPLLQDLSLTAKLVELFLKLAALRFFGCEFLLECNQVGSS